MKVISYTEPIIDIIQPFYITQFCNFHNPFLWFCLMLIKRKIQFNIVGTYSINILKTVNSRKHNKL